MGAWQQGDGADVTLDELTREQLLEIIVQQAIFTECLRRVSNVALAHAGHLVGNYTHDVPKEKTTAWANAQIDAIALLTYPAPVVPPATH